MPNNTVIQYKCKYCDKTESKPANGGRPNAGNCYKRPKNRDGSWKPHSWVVNRKFF